MRTLSAKDLAGWPLLFLLGLPGALLQAQTGEAFLEEAAIVPHTLPVLQEAPSSPLAHLRLRVGGTTGAVTLTSLEIGLGPGGDYVEHLQLFQFPDGLEPSAVRNPDAFDGARQLARRRSDGDTAQLRPDVSLPPGSHDLWLAGTVRGLPLDASVSTTLPALTVREGNEERRVVLEARSSGAQRIGIALRRQGDDGAHTYRIPALATTTHGTLIAVYDVRHRNASDLPGDIDVGMSRSTDGGATWEPMRIVLDMSPEESDGEDNPAWRWDGVGDPSILVDRERGTVWVAATWSHGDRAWHGSGPGLEPEETGQLVLTRSDDDGVTWSAPINITAQVKEPEWSYLLQGPGKGITLRDGTLVFAAQFQDTPQNDRLPRSTILYSRDHGESWSLGTGAFDDTTEAQVVEVEPGVLMLNSRYNREDRRVVRVTRDLGRTWETHPSSLDALVEPGACMASLIDPVAELAGLPGSEARGDLPSGLLLFSNPDSTQQRERITIKASLDRGLTWPDDHRLLLDQGRGAGYSCMTLIDAETVGILYEGSLAHLVFQRVPLSELLGEE